MPFAPGGLRRRQPRRPAPTSPARRYRALVLAAVLAIVCALVPDPVTMARAPAAYVPLDDALFTPVGDLGLPSADGPAAARYPARDNLASMGEYAGDPIRGLGNLQLSNNGRDLAVSL